MVQNRQVTLLGDSILKGIQVDLGDRRYRTHNEINMEALESEFQLSIHNDAHFGATVRKGSRLLDRLLDSLTVPWDLSASPLYRHLATKEAAGEAQSVLLEPLLDQVEADPDCAFLREMPEYGTMVEKYRRAADGA